MYKDFELKKVEICEYDACVVRYALAQRLKDVTADVELLRLSKYRDLTQTERWQLPEQLSHLNQIELQEQIDPWCSLVILIKDLIERFTLKDNKNGIE